ncbi:MAG TPA: HAD family hydrolase [Chthonomonadaceae bacterium]|nr:HAD family hydrolase [Chthonomonadaceae bacterium]
MIRGIVFDFDGLILDTEAPEYQSWQEIYAEHGCTLPLSNWVAGVGKRNESISFSPYDHLEAQLGRALDRAAIREKRRQRYAELIAAQTILPGVEDYLMEAKRLGLKIGLASSSDREWVSGHLGKLGLQAHFECMKCVEDVQRAKPDPDLYLAALDALGLQPYEAIALEDSPVGIAAAKQAGLFCVAVPNPLTCQLPLDQADLRLSSLAEMPLARLLAEVERGRS